MSRRSAIKRHRAAARSLWGFVARLGVIIALLLQTSAPAAGHEAPVDGDSSHRLRPTAPAERGPGAGTCEFDGVVTVDEGLHATPSHDTYNFSTLTLTCRFDLPGIPDGSYAAHASGAMDGEASDAEGNRTHGGTCLQGWSRGPGELTVDGMGGGDGTVEFVRGGTVVQAWGSISFGPAGTLPARTFSFDAVLRVDPTGETDWERGCGGTHDLLVNGPKITQADVTGNVVFYQEL